MEHFVQIPTNFLDFKKSTKLKLVYTYALIRSQIKTKAVNNIYKSCISEKELAQYLGTTERTIINYIKTLSSEGFIIQIDKVSNTGTYKHNCYKLPFLYKYSFFNSSLLYATDLDATLKGLLIYLKLNCFNGTNIIEYSSISELANKLGLNRNKLGNYIKQLSDLNYLTLQTGWLYLNQDFFPLYIDNNLENKAYKFIYDFCIERGCIPPYKSVTNKTKVEIELLKLLETSFYVEKDNKLYGYEALTRLLDSRIKNLPNKVNFEYFLVALTDTVKTTKEFDTIIL